MDEYVVAESGRFGRVVSEPYRSDAVYVNFWSEKLGRYSHSKERVLRSSLRPAQAADFPDGHRAGFLRHLTGSDREALTAVLSQALERSDAVTDADRAAKLVNEIVTPSGLRIARALAA